MLHSTKTLLHIAFSDLMNLYWYSHTGISHPYTILCCTLFFKLHQHMPACFFCHFACFHTIVLILHVWLSFDYQIFYLDGFFASDFLLGLYQCSPNILMTILTIQGVIVSEKQLRKISRAQELFHGQYSDRRISQQVLKHHISDMPRFYHSFHFHTSKYNL